MDGASGGGMRDKGLADRLDYGRSLTADCVRTEDATVMALRVVNRPGQGLRVEGAYRPVQGPSDSRQDMEPGGREP